MICSVVSIATSFIRRKPFPDQKDVVCKMRPGSLTAAQVLQLPILAQELSCCLQETQLPLRPAKPLPRNALGPKLRCCLQDCADAVCDRGASAVDGSVRPRRGAPCGTVSSIPNYGPAIFVGYRGRPRGIPDRPQSFGGDTRHGAYAGRPIRCRPPGEVETSKVERTSGSNGTGVHP